jgi:SAM-dependent methyltransferase
MTEEWLEANHGWWEERAALHPGSDLYDIDAFVAGRDDLRPWEPEILGPVDGLDLVHLQCHIGTDTLGWARRGARVTGLDFSATALAAAAALAERCGMDADWVEADVYDARAALGPRVFDVVYTGIGALGWLPDLERWAGVVRSLLRPGGRLYLMEVHPMWVALGDDGRTLREHAVDADFQVWVEDEPQSYALPGATLEHGTTYERLHGLGDILSAVLSAGLVIEQFREHARTPAPTGWLERGSDGLYGFAEGRYRFPLTFSLLARSPS